jgi:membrane-associated PAP2 superfamily phosphatase
LNPVSASGPGRGAWRLGLALLAVLAWDLSGWDIAVSAASGGAAGFPLRQPGSWASQAHEAGRWLAAIALLAMALHAGWTRRFDRPLAAERGWAALATLLTLLAVPALKRASQSSCPWDLVDFGGGVPYVPHLWPGTFDGGLGHCFPSGHAVAALAFLVPALAWRHRVPAAGSWGVVAVLLMGALFGAVQDLRGAHLVSHVLWSAWLCAAVALAYDTAARRLRQAAGRPSF